MGEDAKLLWQRRLGLKHSFDGPVLNIFHLPKHAFLLVILRQRNGTLRSSLFLI
jgi:hypothetical protein